MPEDLLAAAIQRIRAEHDIPPARAALIRLILNRLMRHSAKGGTEMKEVVDVTQANAAYRCGRLFAVLARLQYLVLGSTNATIVDRFYGTASTAPASIFGQLMHLHHAHLSKLAAARPGAATNIRKDIEEITTQPDLLTEFPLQLSLQDQGRFALGFYHQMADYRRRSAEQGGSEGEEPLPTPSATEVSEVSE
ncbi:MAG: type I-C CRISPR-associated protein Cas8c/Csd1 [Candidatus Zipacnadales bacterium]